MVTGAIQEPRDLMALHSPFFLGEVRIEGDLAGRSGDEEGSFLGAERFTLQVMDIAEEESACRGGIGH